MTGIRVASGMSQLAYHFLGGLISHARALTAVVAPTVNDYKRLSVGEFLTGVSSGFTWTPACISWGDNNRTQMFRTPDAGRFECRVVSGAVNPYLGLAAFIGAGLDGITRSLDPGEPFVGNLYDLSLSDIKARKLEFVPQVPAGSAGCLRGGWRGSIGAWTRAGRRILEGKTNGMGALSQHGESVGD